MIQYMTPIDYWRTSMALMSRTAELQVEMMRMSFGMADGLTRSMGMPGAAMMQMLQPSGLSTKKPGASAPKAPARSIAPVRPFAGLALLHPVEKTAETPKPATQKAPERKTARKTAAPATPKAAARTTPKAPARASKAKRVSPSAAAKPAASETVAAPAEVAPKSAAKARTTRRRTPSAPATPENLTAPETKKASRRKPATRATRSASKAASAAPKPASAAPKAASPAAAVEIQAPKTVIESPASTAAPAPAAVTPTPAPASPEVKTTDTSAVSAPKSEKDNA